MKVNRPAEESWSPIRQPNTNEQPPAEGTTPVSGPGKSPGHIRCSDEALMTPLRWYKPRRATISAACDLFDEDMNEGALDEVLAAIALTWLLSPDHRFLITTANPERMAGYLLADNRNRIERITEAGIKLLQNNSGQCLQQFAPHHKWPLPRKKLKEEDIDAWLTEGSQRVPRNLWTGVSVYNQETADQRTAELQRIPSPVRFIKAEPLEDELRLEKWLGKHKAVQWVITGAGTGKDAKPCNVEWLQSIVAQCRHAGVAAFVTQVGRPAAYRTQEPTAGSSGKRLRSRTGADPDEWPEDLRCRQWPEPAQRFWVPR